MISTSYEIDLRLNPRARTRLERFLGPRRQEREVDDARLDEERVYLSRVGSILVRGGMPEEALKGKLESTKVVSYGNNQWSVCLTVLTHEPPPPDARLRLSGLAED